MTGEAEAIWTRTAERIKQEVPPGTFNLWFAHVRAAQVDERSLELTAPSEYVRDRLTRNHLDLITKLVGQVSGRELEVRLEADDPTRSRSDGRRRAGG